MIIWLEVELHSSRYDVYDISLKEWLYLDRFVTKDWLKVKMSKDYYRSTIEYNFEPKQLSETYFQKVTDFLQKQVKKYGLKIKCNWPGYVWTHVHIFDIKYRKVWTHKVLSTVMQGLDPMYNKLYKQDKLRLVTSHQLWGNYVYEHYWNEYQDLLYDHWLKMHYPELSHNRPKYNPVIISNRSNKGKPRSIEIRIIPNQILFNGWLYKILDTINKWEYANIKPCEILSMLSNWLHRLNTRS